MRLIQLETAEKTRAVGVVKGGTIETVKGVGAMRELALKAIEQSVSLETMVSQLGCEGSANYEELIAAQRVLPPLDHEDPAHMLIVGTGLTHVASAAARDQMHQKLGNSEDASLSDSMRMFKWGLEGGKPANGEPGVQPEWFYKGDGSIVVRPGQAFPVPGFADDMGEEPEIVGLYVIGNDGKPYRLGFAIGNEATDHVMEKKNYLYLPHSKLRFCSYGPELVTGELPSHIEGKVRLRRGNDVVWEKSFPTGEDNMCHSLANLEYHHFKYDQFLRPGDVHVHFMGTSVASFADDVKTQNGDTFEIAIDIFGKPLINAIERTTQKVGMNGVSPL